MTDDVLHRHLNGGPHAGMYLIPAGSDRVRIAAFDLDDHEGTLPWSRMADVATSRRRIAAERFGFQLLPLRSGGGHGIHLFAAWNEPVPARDVRAAMRTIVGEVGFRDGTEGIAAGQIEIFPKQDEVGDRYGNLIALPFARDSVPLDEQMQPAAAPIAWNESNVPPAATPEERKRSVGSQVNVPIEDVKAALALIPNDETVARSAERGAISYIAVGMAVHASTGGSDEGLAAWDAWARQRKDKYDKNRPNGVDRRSPGLVKQWRSFKERADGLGFGSLVRWAREVEPGWTPPSRGVSLDDFHAYMPQHNYIYAPTRALWPAASVNDRIPPVPLPGVVDANGKRVVVRASVWLGRNRPVEQMTWMPGLPVIVKDRLVVEGGWIERFGATVFNLYLPPTVEPGDPVKAAEWVDHVRYIYPDDAAHIFDWLAHRVQRPEEKINHALVLGGKQGIGKDTLLEPVKHAVGPWNFEEVSPVQVLGRFNGFLKSVVLRISEARDLGDSDRFKFYEHMKAYTAAPPDVLRVDEKNLREHPVFNVCGVIYTTNHKTGGIYLPSEDRRHFVAWSTVEKEDKRFAGGYLRVPVDCDHGFRWKVITQSGGT